MNSLLGSASLSPQTSAISGKHSTWTITYTVGSYGVDSGGQLKIAIRIVSDWGVPQFTDPQAEGYSTVTTNGAAKLRANWNPRGYIRPWSKAIVIDVYDGSLSPGDEIKIVLGDTSQGSPGLRAQTYVESAFEFRVLVDPTNSTDPRPIDSKLTLPIIADEATSIDCIVPSQGMIGEPIDIFVKGEDIWRNPVLLQSMPSYKWVGSGAVRFEVDRLIAETAAQGYVEVEADGMRCHSNPITIEDGLPTLKRYWGDLHAQTGGTVGVGTEDEYFTFGRDVAKLDFISHQGNDFQITADYWQHLNDVSERYHQDGAFVVFPGYEWSGSSPTGGDHNVIYRKPNQPILRSSHWLVPQEPATDLSPAHPADVFYKKLKSVVPVDDVLVCQHVGGRYANLRKYFDQDLISLVEVVSVWGVFEWMLWDAIDRNYIVGVMANSDGHHGRPGAEGSGMTEFGIRNGLTCVLAEAQTRDAIFDALKSRHCYATTGPRMLLDFSLAGHPMGSVLALGLGDQTVAAQIQSAQPVERLQLYEGHTLLEEVFAAEFSQIEESNLLRISWLGSRERGRQRRTTWDGSIYFEGTQVQSVETFAFDVVADGVIDWNANQIDFKSKTTGDRDGLSIVLSDPTQGKVIFDSTVGRYEFSLADLVDGTWQQTIAVGGVDLTLTIERYPAHVQTTTLSLSKIISPPQNQLTAYFVKAIRVDGEMAWASPIWIDNRR